jgi:hypothetical protein
MPHPLWHAPENFSSLGRECHVTKRDRTIVFLVFVYTFDGTIEMKRIVALFVCGLLLAVSSTAEARWSRRNNGGTYNQPTQYAPAATSAQRTTAYKPVTTEPAAADTTINDTSVATASASMPAPATTVDYSTRTAQGVANIMASRNQVGHWGGNPGYEGCGCGATPQAAYNICCYANSGMATVDVGYARSASGMWYCCRRYR